MLQTALLPLVFFLAQPLSGDPAQLAAPVPLWHAKLPELASTPVVADAHEQPGLETIALQSAPARVVCLDSSGKDIWTADLPAVPVAPPAVSRNGLLAVSTKSGIICFDAASGRQRWEKDIAGISAYPPVWADIDYNELDELLVPAGSGLAAVDAEGNHLWRYPEDPDEEAAFAAPLVAVDAEQDGPVEVFALVNGGLVCLESDGFERWQAPVQGTLDNAHIIAADLDSDTFAEIYLASGIRLTAYDAAFGDERSTLSLDEPLVALAAGDLDRNGTGELVTVQRSGAVAVYSMDAVLYRFEETVGGPTAVLAADVNGDTELEVLAAGKDSVAVLGSSGGSIDTAPRHGILIADVNGDGITDLIAAERTGIRAYALGGRWWAAFQHWPQPRHDAAQTGAWVESILPRDAVTQLGDYTPAAVTAVDLPLVQGSSDLLPRGGFDAATLPEDWAVTGNAEAIVFDAERYAAGSASLRIEPRESALKIASAPIPVTAELRQVSAGLLVQGADAIDARLVWRRQGETVSSHPLERLPAELPGGWTRFNLNPVPKPGYPSRAYELVFTVEVPPSESPIWLDEAQVKGATERIPSGGVLVNQVSYELIAPKHVVVQANFEPREATFALVDAQGQHVYTGRFAPAERIFGAYQHDWGQYYLRGDFSAWAAEGDYTIEARLDGLRLLSTPLSIQFNGLWERTIDDAVRFFRERRPADDAPPTALWRTHDEEVDTVRIAWDLIRSYDAAIAQFSKRTAEGEPPPLLREITWAGRRLRAAWDEESRPAPAAQYAAIFARLFRVAHDKSEWWAAAESALKAANLEDSAQELRFSAALDLYLATKEERFAESAHALYPGASILIPESIAYYDGEFENMATFELAGNFAAAADVLLKRARSPFAICTQGDTGNYFGTPPEAAAGLWGNSAYLLESAASVAKAYRFNPRPEYLAFMHDQFNWILGANPFGICLMAGKGAVGPAAYADTPIPGGIVHGIRGEAPGVDTPAFDREPAVRSNGQSLRATAAWISALANLKRIPVAEPD